MRYRITFLLLLILLLLCGCSSEPEDDRSASMELSSEENSSVALPSVTETVPLPETTEAPETTEPDAGLEGTIMTVPSSLIVMAAEPTAEFDVSFPKVDLTGAPDGRDCELELYVDNVLEHSRPFVLKPGASLRCEVPYTFSRFMEQDWSRIKVVVRYGEESIDEIVPVNLINYPDEVYTAQTGDKYPYSIDIIRNRCEIVVYGRRERGAEYNIPIKIFVCSTGYRTPLGDFWVGAKYRWKTLNGPCYGQYSCHITGNVLFHSVPYFTPQMDNLETFQYNRLGTICSMGCVRLCVRDAKWIYDNCPTGTPIHIYDAVEAPFERPEPIKLDPDDPRSGWDPTDPNENNPWNPLYGKVDPPERDDLALSAMPARREWEVL